MINEILRNAIYYIEAFLRRPLWAILPAVLTVAVGLGVVSALPRSYQTEAQILVEAPQSGTSLVPSTVANEHLQVIEQRVLARDKLLALAEKLDLFSGLRSTMSETKLAQLVRQNIRINTVITEPSERYSGAALMRIGFTASTAVQASATVAELVNMIIEENRGLRMQRATEMSGFLSREVEDLEGKLKAREADWNTFYDQNSEALPARAQAMENELQEKERELVSLDASISTLEQELRLLEAELRLGLESPASRTYERTQLADLEAELATKSLTYSDAHPEIRALVQKIEGVRQKIAAGANGGANDSANLTPELALVSERIKIATARHDSLVAKRADVNERIAWLHTTSARVPGVQSRLEVIEHERQTLQTNLDEMRSRLATARVGERLESENSTGHVQVLEEAETPRYPSSTSRTRMMLLVIAGAFAVGAGCLYLRDTLQRTLRGTFDLTSHLSGSTLLVIPNWAPEEMHKSPG